MNDTSQKADFNLMLRKYQKTRDERYLNMFFHRVRRPIFRLFLKRGVEFQKIEDVFQDAAIVFLRRLDRWDENRGKAFSFFLIHVEHALATDGIHRKRKKRNGPCRNFSDFAIQEDGRGDAMESILNIASREENEPILDADEREAIRKLVGELQGREFQVAAGICFDGLCVRQTAEKLGMSLPVAWRQVKSLRSHFMNHPSVQRMFGGEQTKPLTDRQIQVVRLIHVEKVTQREAGRRLGLSKTGVGYHWKTALKKIAASEELQTLTGIGPGMYGI